MAKSMDFCKCAALLASAVCASAVSAVRADTLPVTAYIQDGLVVQYDGIENAGTGAHDPAATVWVDLTGNGHDLVLNAGDTVGTDCVNIIRGSRTASNAIFTAYSPITIEFNARPTAMDKAGNWASAIANIPYIGALGWAAHSNSKALFVKRPRSEADENDYYRSYNSGYSSLANLIAAAVYQTYAACPGLGTKSEAASRAYINGAAVAATSGLNWESTDNPRAVTNLALVVGGAKTTSDVRSIRIYNRELTAAEIAINNAVDKVRFDGAELSTVLPGYHYNAALGIVVKDAQAWKLDISGTPINAATPTPAYGSTNVLADGATFLCAAPAVWTNAACDTAAVCAGYKVYTNATVYAEGVATNFTYVHPDCADGASLVWQWAAEYKTTATSTGTGTVAPAEQWTAHSDTATVSATPGEGWAFHKWTGDVPPDVNVYAPTISFAADRPRALVAEFNITWEGTTNIALTAATKVYVPAGQTNRIDKLSGAYPLTKTGEGVLEIRWAASSGGSIVISEGTVHFTTPRPDDLFARAYFHVDANDPSTMTIETANGTNFVTRWNDADGRTDRYATHCTTVWNCRKNPENRKPFLREGFQNGLPVMDFGRLLTTDNTNQLGEAIGYGAAMKFDRTTPYIKEGFTVASDTEDYYEASSKGSGMSFFSHETSYRFTRCSANPTAGTYLGIMADNAQNNDYFDYGKSVWLDGNVLTGHPKWTRPSAGFHILRIHPTKDGNTTFNSFGAEYHSSTSRSYGGQRIAEYVLFTNATETGESTMTAGEATTITGYLKVKWFPVSIASVTIEKGASFAVDEDVKLSVPITDNGARNISLGCQTAIFNKLSKVGAWIHVDASQTNTMTIVTENGTNYVTRWNDVDGGAGYCYDENTTGLGGQRTNPEKRKPYLNPELTQNGLPIIDLGSAIHYWNTNGHGAAFMIGGLDRTYIREYLSVISDTEDLKTSGAGYPGPSYISYRGGTAPWSGQNGGRRGELVSGKNPPLFRSSDNSACVNGDNYVNGVKQAFNYNPPDGFNIVNVRPTSGLWCNLIGRNIRGVSGQHIDSYGGQRIAEYMLFTSAIDDTKRQRIYNALRNKWYGDTPATTNVYNLLALGAEADLTVKYEAVAVTDTLSLAGRLTAPYISAANIAVASTGAAVDGALTLADGATLTFTRLPDDTWTSLSATSVTAEGAVTVTLSGSLKGMGGKSVRLIATDNPPASLAGWTLEFDSNATTARLVLKDDGIWAEFLSPGLIFSVK